MNTYIPYRTIGSGSITHRIYHGDNTDIISTALSNEHYDIIYIDPPYNTRNNNMSYDDNRDEVIWEQWMTEFAAIVAARLKDDGLLFVSIDDNNYPTLRRIYDPLLRHLGTFIWQKRGRFSATNGISEDHEYVMCYGGKSARTDMLRLGSTGNNKRTLRDEHYAERGWYDLDHIQDTKCTPTFWGPITCPDGTKIWPYDDDTMIIGRHYPYGWRYTKDRFESLLANDFIVFKHDSHGRMRAYVKSYEKMNYKQEPKDPFCIPISTLDILHAGYTSAGTNRLNSIIGRNKFSFAKPVNLMTEIVRMHPAYRADLPMTVMYPFAGSATMADAVMQLNASSGRTAGIAYTGCGDDGGKDGTQFDRVTSERAIRVLTGREWADGKTHDDYSADQQLVLYECKDDDDTMNTEENI